MKSFKSFIVEAKKDGVVFTFGRFNPMTIGHEKLINAVNKIARKNKFEPRIYPSRTHDNKRNPIPPKEKTAFLKKMFKQSKIVGSPDIKNPFDVVMALDREGFTRVIMVVGSDRVSEFKSRLGPFIEKETKITDFSVASAGDRDPDVGGVEGASGTKQREFVKMNDFESFKKGLPRGTSPRLAHDVFTIIKKNLK